MASYNSRWIFVIQCLIEHTDERTRNPHGLGARLGGGSAHTQGEGIRAESGGHHSILKERALLGKGKGVSWGRVSVLGPRVRNNMMDNADNHISSSHMVWIWGAQTGRNELRP